MMIAPTAYDKLQRFDPDKPVLQGAAASEALVDRIADLEKQLKEMRQDNRRVAELYDLVFERLRQDNPLSKS
jgi:molecular chaperone GrpE (heat shock protein)